MWRPEGEKPLGRSGPKWENNVKNRSSLSGMAIYGLDAAGSEQWNLAGACGYCNLAGACGYCNLAGACGYCNLAGACRYCNLARSCGCCNFSTSCGTLIFAERMCSMEIERRLFNKIMPRQTVQVNKLYGERLRIIDINFIFHCAPHIKFQEFKYNV